MASREPGWVGDTVWWHVYPLGFTGADTSGADRAPAGGLAMVERWLDYAAGLGATGLALGPVFESSTHGYDTVDHDRIDTRLGTDADFDRLVAAVHERGMRLLLDGVFNHVGRGFPAFRRVLELGPDAPEAGWFRLRWPAGAGPGTEPGYADFEGHHGLVALDHASPAVADHVVAVMDRWLGRGADGWRLDAAYAVPTSFWRSVTARVRAAHPDAYFVGEVIHGDYASFVTDGGLDGVTQYELWKAIWSSVEDGNLFELAHALGRHDGYLELFAPMTFVGNHDVTRLATTLTDARHLAHAVVVLLTVGGTPSVYYGDEQGFVGRKEDRAGGDDAVRPAFPADAADLAPDGAWLHDLHRRLIRLRRDRPGLHRARTEVLELANEHIVYATGTGAERVVVALNLADGELRVDVADPGAVLAAGPGAGVDGDRLTVPGHGWLVTGP